MQTIIVLTDSTRLVVTCTPAGMSVAEEHQDRGSASPWLPGRAIWCPAQFRVELQEAVGQWTA